MSEVLDFSESEIQQMLDNLDKFTPEEVQEVDRIVSELDILIILLVSIIGC